jgi:hypothetical protein
LETYAPEYAGVGQLLGKTMADAMIEEIKQAFDAFDKLKVYMGASSSNSSPSSLPKTDNTQTTQTSGTYTVKSGDSLWTIAGQVYKNSNRWVDLASKNGLTPPYTIRVGQVLKYLQGGLVKNTGLAWLDGTAGRPEVVLNPLQTEIFRRFVQYLPQLEGTVMSGMPNIVYNAPIVQNDINIVNNTPFDVANNMDNLNRAIKRDLINIGHRFKA